MTVFFVSRHEGALRWARILQKTASLPFDIDNYVSHIDPASLKKGDVVIGTLPIREAHRLREQGVRFLNLDLQVPPELRGQELSATQMAACGATLTEYRVTVKESFELDPVRARRRRMPAGSKPALTVMLVSHELMPQFLGYLHAPTPQVVLIVTASMQRRADQLQALLNKATPRPHKIIQIPLNEAEGYPGMRAQADSLMDELLAQRCERVVINLTGGTKLMSLAFGDAGRAARREHDRLDILYVDTAQGRLEFLDGTSAQPMHALLGVADAVLASGKADAGCASASPMFQQQMQRTPLHQHLLSADPGVIGDLNSLGVEMDMLLAGRLNNLRWLDAVRSKASDGVFVLSLGTGYSGEGMRRRLAGKLGQLLLAQGVLRAPVQQDNGQIWLKLARPSEISYLKGGWLEAYIASIIRKAAPDDWACGVQVGKEAGKNNEIDAIVTCGNRTLLLEVKTANLAREERQDDGESKTKGQDTIYKLDSVGHDLARNFNDNWLISARYLSPVDFERARDKRIQVFAPASRSDPAHDALNAFKKALTRWVEDNRERVRIAPEQSFRQLDISQDWHKAQQKDARVAHRWAESTETPPEGDAAPSGGLSDKALAKLAELKAKH